MKISIIIPTYNCEKYIKKAIDSVLDQPYQDKELIVVDGGSNDDTVEILKSYSDKIKWVSEKDNGQADAIQKGFKIATGEIVAWLNADDFYEPNIFEVIANSFKENPSATLVYGNQKYVNESGELIKTRNAPQNITLKKLVNNLNPISQPSSFYRRSDVEKSGGIDLRLSFLMEYDLYIKLRKLGEFIYIDRLLSNFTIRKDQKSGQKNTIKMDKEVWEISRANGGNFFSKILALRIYNLVRYYLKLI